MIRITRSALGRALAFLASLLAAIGSVVSGSE